MSLAEDIKNTVVDFLDPMGHDDEGLLSAIEDQLPKPNNQTISKDKTLPMEIGVVLPSGWGHTNVHIVLDENGKAYVRFCTEADEEHAEGTDYEAWCEGNVNMGSVDVKVLFGEAKFDENAKMFDKSYQLIDDDDIQNLM